MSVKEKIAYGDFQTPEPLAAQVVSLIKELFPHPSVIVEPTCGTGNFIKAAISAFNGQIQYYGFDINTAYTDQLRQTVINKQCFIEPSDFFEKNWEQFFSGLRHEAILIIGNPPWVTNSALSVLNSNNTPGKSNFQNQKGFAAKTGKANFDIAEWMLIKLIESLKNKKGLRGHALQNGYGKEGAEISMAKRCRCL